MNDPNISQELLDKIRVSHELAIKALREIREHGTAVTPCPKRHTIPKLTMTSRGERRTISCECRHVFTEEIIF